MKIFRGLPVNGVVMPSLQGADETISAGHPRAGAFSMSEFSCFRHVMFRSK